MVTIQIGVDSIVAVPTNWRKVRVTWLDAQPSEARARWKDGRLQIERRFDDGSGVTEYYSRSPGSSRLVVYTTVDGWLRTDATVRRVYDAVIVGN
jgi:hypothetical protein